MMKKLILLLPCTIFPYSLLFGLYCFIKGFGNVGEVFYFLPWLFIISLVCNIVFLVLSIFKKWSSSKISFYNMVIKLVQIPAYVLIFILGVLCFATLFTMGISVFFVLFDCLSIILTGMIGIAAISRCYADGVISKRFSIFNGLLQFVFCVDIISAIAIFAKSKLNHSSSK